MPETLQSSRQTIGSPPVEGVLRMDSLQSNQLASDEDNQTVTLQPRHLDSTDSVSSGKKPVNMNKNYVHIKKVATTAQGSSRLK